MKIKPCVALMCAGLVLGGCSLLDPSPSYLAATLKTHGWAVSLEEDESNVPTVYCYKTLGSRDCYSTPQKGWEGRLIESFVAPQSPKTSSLTPPHAKNNKRF